MSRPNMDNASFAELAAWINVLEDALIKNHHRPNYCIYCLFTVNHAPDCIVRQIEEGQ